MTTENNPDATKLPQAFRSACARTFDSPLAGYGFVRQPAELEPTQCTQRYVAGERYIEVRANAEPRDFPFYCNVVLGEGRTDWPERDWNSIALWRLIRDRASTASEVSAGEYPLGDRNSAGPIPDDLSPIFRQMRDDLLRYATDFLAGDVQAFRRVRAAQARERTPYTVHKPNGRGGYTSSADPESAALRERFSREDMG